MRNPAIKLCLAALLLALPIPEAEAQFYSVGNDPGSTKWSQITTDSYRIVYPQGYDSLAVVYALWLERVKEPVGASLGYVPNGNFSKQMPVVLHPFSAVSNGMVTWAPRRMELYTVPDPFDPIPLEWPLQLAVHESRHVAQMQPECGGFAGMAGKILTGDLFAGAMSAILGGPAAMEGDAVLAETSLTNSGRGRNADFLEYQRACFAEGDFRDYWKWLYGSQKYHTPDHYTIGYISRAGMKAFCGFDRWPYNSVSGRLKKTFPAIADSLAAIWEENAAARGPFMKFRKVTESPTFKEYTSLCGDSYALLAIRSGIDEAPCIVKLAADGSCRRMAWLSQGSSRIRYSSADSLIYWSEIRRDPRWELRSYSEVWRMNPATGRRRPVTRKTRYFNPSVSDDGLSMSVVEYPEDGTSAIAVLNPHTGQVVERKTLPAGLQAVETVFLGDKLYFSAINGNGISIYDSDTFEALFRPVSCKIKELGSYGGRITMVSDRNGVDELYSIDPASRDILQITNSEQGSGGHLFREDSLFFSYLSRTGRDVCVAATADLPLRKINFDDIRQDPLAERLSRAETDTIDLRPSPAVNCPQDYSRLHNAIRIHSWVPVYFDYNAVENLSFSTLTTSAGIGATVFFQNDLSTLCGSASYSAWTPSEGFGNAVHALMTYSGLYPVIEASADISDSRPSFISITRGPEGEIKSDFAPIREPSADISFKTYVPLNLSSGGWSRGIVPQIEGNFSNDVISYGQNTVFSGILAMKVRAYSMQQVPSSCIYPRLGLGVEAGYAFKPGMTDLYATALYGYIYGYLPGLCRTHGLRLSLLTEGNFSDGILAFRYANVAPRGAATTIKELCRYPLHGKFSFDYALPFAAVDWSFTEPLAYVRNFELTAHYDCSFFKSTGKSGTVSSLGADLCARLGNLVWIPYDTRIGVGYNFNFGSLETRPHVFNFIFSVDF